MNIFTPMLVLDGSLLAGVAGILVAIGGLITALGKALLSIFHEYLTFRDDQADKTIRALTDENNTLRRKNRKFEKDLLAATKENKERAPSS
jgi:hypothetical protein